MSTESIQCPEVKIIMASGSKKEIEDLRKDLQTKALIPRPFTNEILLKAVHPVLAS
jgi:hypothetical protein